MLNKPIILFLMISAVFFASLLAGSLVHNGLLQGLFCLGILFAFSLYVGISHVRKFNEEMPKRDKIKVSLYFFLFWFIFIESIIFLMVMDSPLRGVHLSFYIRKLLIILPFLLLNLITFVMQGLLIYFGLGLGCKIQLKRLEKNNNPEIVN